MTYIIFALALTPLTVCSAAPQSSECAVRVSVYDYAREPADGAPVTLQMNSGGPAKTAVSRRGMVEFCDVGWGTFSITVGLNPCGQVVVRNLYIRWTQTLEIPVLYENCHGLLVNNGCLVMFRFHSPDGKPVEGVHVQPERGSPSQSDRYGRAVIAMSFGATADVKMSSPGYAAETVRTACERGASEIEKAVTLRPASP